MRISNQLIQTFVNRINSNARETMFDAIEQASSGRSVQTPSDDPLTASRIVGLDQIISRLDTYDRAGGTVSLDLQLADSAMQQSIDILGDAKALAIQMANPATDATDRAAAIESAQGYLDQLLSLANQRTEDGRFLFGGVAEGAQPYDEFGNYVGSSGTRRVEVGAGVFVDGTIVGADGFGASGEIFEKLQNFIERLESGDGDAIAESIDELDQALDFALVRGTAIGARIAAIDNAELLNEELRSHFTIERAQVAEIDLTAAFSAVTAANTALQAVSTLGNKLLTSSLAGLLQ